MSLPINKSDDFLFYKTLNEDVKLKSNKHSKYDIQMSNGDYVNVTGQESLKNAIIIAIMTRYNELNDIPIYDNFGCRVHELIKVRQTGMTRYKMELFITDVLENMRRIKEINNIEINDESHSYFVKYSVTSIDDELINDGVTL
ncbi:DUF2634 domain-containing protein [Methanobrevibacter sp. V74]|uniref:DUF2634 domain-containing protein n=1 Tax=Methanobrevibacter sp. V74 TaxID=3064279 RepID=UPI0027346D2B|nr:DUF2634 domain-containing protein [Methanobrevibacter sp. V74]